MRAITNFGSMALTSICIVLLLQLLIMIHPQVHGGHIVKSLPGFEGELPFKLETGYLQVEESELFYYFLESEGNPEKDPFMLWFSGGPGCSAFNGFIYQIGPLAFDIDNYTGGLPTLKYVEYSWTKTASILLVDSPVGTGFSYASDPAYYPTTSTKWAHHNYLFLKKWLTQHPQYLKLQLFVGADSFAGTPLPILVQYILDGNKAGEQPLLNFKGFIAGCPLTDVILNTNAKVPFINRVGLIPDELYKAASEACDGNYFYQKDLSNTKCTDLVNKIDYLTKGINTYSILEPKCSYASSDVVDPYGVSERRRLSSDDDEDKFVLSPPKISELWCRNFNYVLSVVLMNDPLVKQALHIREGTIERWVRCNATLSFTDDAYSVLGYYRNFTKTDLYGLVYNGDCDYTIPNTGTQEWIQGLNLTVDDAWRPWFVDGEVAGYVEKYEKDWFRLTYATIKGAGHSPQEFKRRESFEMFKRWINWYPV